MKDELLQIRKTGTLTEEGAKDMNSDASHSHP